MLAFLSGNVSNVNANNEGFVYFPLAHVGSFINDLCRCSFGDGKLRDLGFLSSS